MVPQPVTDALAALGVDPRAVVAAVPMPPGLSGAALWRLTLRHTLPGGAAWYATRVLKLLPAGGGWLAALAEEQTPREARLVGADLLARVAPTVEHGALQAAEYASAGGEALAALLLRDERAHLWPGPPHADVGRVLDGLARLHAAYWQRPALEDAAADLLPARAALCFFAPARLRAVRAAGAAEAYRLRALAGWECFLALATPEARDVLARLWAEPAPVLAALATLPATLVHGDVWRPNLGLLPPTHRAPRRGYRLLLLDWALATRGPATYDPLWLCGTWHSLHPPHVLAYYRARLMRHLAARGHTLPAATWQRLMEVGYLRTVLTCGEAFGQAVLDAPAGGPRQRAEARARWWAARALHAAARLL